MHYYRGQLNLSTSSGWSTNGTSVAITLKARLIITSLSLQSQYSNHQAVLAKEPPYSEFPPQTFLQPLDHDDPSSPTFEQRYWVNTRHYKKGGPVIVIDGGETSGEDRLPVSFDSSFDHVLSVPIQFLDTGIADILAKATHGLGVVLEHRYYGKNVTYPSTCADFGP